MYRYNYVSQSSGSNRRLSTEPNLAVSGVAPYPYREEPAVRRYVVREEKVVDKSRRYNETYETEDAKNDFENSNCQYTCEGGSCRYTCQGGGRCRYTCEGGSCRYTCDGDGRYAREGWNSLFNHYQPDVRACQGDNCPYQPNVRACQGNNCQIEDYPNSTCQGGICTRPRLSYR